uniref:Maleate isomerase n=1 Tax=Candidatus Kentrum sp. MB TaxID=2138164 RepID=A0A451BEV4_9GAMM|nr:MAG: maleate isomerase [Candidatus Kentron sp. MB]VFK76808.1 MAG: maleate isomerase [Candidatus Kentron sp. MB]
MIIIRRAQITQNKRKYIGLLVVSTDPTIERDFRRMLHNIDQVDFFVSRVPYAGVYTPENYRAMEGEINRATALILPGDQLEIIAYGCTSASIETGEPIIFHRVREVPPDIACTTPITAAHK